MPDWTLILREEMQKALGSPYAERMHGSAWEKAAVAALDRVYAQGHRDGVTDSYGPC